jgi:Ca2+-binding EF-hand superfamily protein
LADNIPARRIYFKEFIDKLYSTLFSEVIRDQMKFIFTLYDLDFNGLLNGPDLLTTQDSLDLYSELSHELQYIVDHYVATHLLIKD